MKSVAKMDEDLSTEERNLLSVAYKNVIGAKRAAWRVISSVEERAGKNEDQKSIIASYKKQVEEELNTTCQDILTILDNHLITHAKNDEGKVFFYKM